MGKSRDLAYNTYSAFLKARHILTVTVYAGTEWCCQLTVNFVTE